MQVSVLWKEAVALRKNPMHALTFLFWGYSAADCTAKMMKHIFVFLWIIFIFNKTHFQSNIHVLPNKGCQPMSTVCSAASHPIPVLLPYPFI